MIENAKTLVESCILCGACAEVCPFFKATGETKFGAMAKVEAAIALFNGKELGEEDLKTLSLCTRCDRCHDACPVNVPVADVIQGARAELRRLKKVPEKYNTVAEAIIRTGSPMATPPEKRRAHIPEGFVAPKTAKYLYITGCWSGIKMPETAKATIELLQKAGLDFTILGEKESCCGLFLIDTGMLEETKKIAEANTLLFESTGAEVLVTECPSCHDVYKSVYPKLYREPKYRVVHISELLKELLDGCKIELSPAQKERKIIFKDPCPLVRRHGIIEPPRDIIKRLGTLLEYNENAREALCCGAPAGVKPVYPELANKLAWMLVDEAKLKGADEISVGCVFCMYHMSGVIKDPSQLKIKTLSQEVLESVKL